METGTGTGNKRQLGTVKGDMQRQGTQTDDRNGVEKGDMDRGQWTGDWRQETGNRGKRQGRERDKERNWDKGKNVKRRVLYAEDPFVSINPLLPPPPFTLTLCDSGESLEGTKADWLQSILVCLHNS